ncbi:MAG TPA: hypothetical protein VII76_07020 [Acidimicrobiales bacterium]
MTYTPPPIFEPDQILTAAQMNELGTDIRAQLTVVGISSAALGTPPLVTVGGFLLQAGSTVALTDSGGLVTLTFPSPFPNGVVCVLATPGDDAANFTACVHLEASLTTSVAVVECLNNSGAAIVTSAVRIHWIALGF